MPVDANYTIVRNTSGVRRFFSFLGGNGAFLDAGEDARIPGDLFTRWQNDTIQTSALRRALTDGALEILKTPDVFVFDATDGQVYRLGSAAGSPVSVDPEYGSYAGSAP